MAEERTTDETRNHIIEGENYGQINFWMNLIQLTYMIHTARKRAERKKLTKLGKSTETEDDEDENDEQEGNFELWHSSIIVKVKTIYILCV